MTPAEYLLWQCLRNRQRCHAKFRRQYVKEIYALDFFCPEAHFTLERIEKDRVRTQWLNAQEIEVVRFRSQEIGNETQRVSTSSQRYRYRFETVTENRSNSSSPNPFWPMHLALLTTSPNLVIHRAKVRLTLQNMAEKRKKPATVHYTIVGSNTNPAVKPSLTGVGRVERGSFMRRQSKSHNPSSAPLLTQFIERCFSARKERVTIEMNTTNGRRK